MARNSGSRPPRHLSPEARGLWQSIAKDYAIDCPAALGVLTAAMESFDRATEARKLLDAEGAVVKDRWGQSKVHPAASVERDSRAAYLQALKALSLDIAPPGEER